MKSWEEALIGGLILGVNVSVYLHLTGRITGISGFVSGVLTLDKKSFGWKIQWVAGLLLAAGFFGAFFPHHVQSPPEYMETSWVGYVVGGLLVGFGTRYGNGCTSGHGICGLARFSPRSIVAVLCFMISAFLTATFCGLHNFLRVERSETFLATSENLRLTVIILSLFLPIILVSLAISLDKMTLRDRAITLIAGLTFGLGLGVSGMCIRSRVLSFLNLDRDWSFDLILVMGGAAAVSMVAFMIAKRRQTTFMGMEYGIPTSQIITFRLVVGSILFGIGWGMTGYCPGPAIMQAAVGNASVLALYLPAMAVGMWIEAQLEQWTQRRLSPDCNVTCKIDEGPRGSTQAISCECVDPHSSEPESNRFPEKHLPVCDEKADFTQVQCLEEEISAATAVLHDVGPSDLMHPHVSSTLSLGDGRVFELDHSTTMALLQQLESYVEDYSVDN